jgi:hypothetical protein
VAFLEAGGSIPAGASLLSCAHNIQSENIMLKIVIALLLAGILISLVCGFVFFYQDKGRSKRVLYALGVRITLAVILLACIVLGLATGQLTMQAPWL